MATVRDILMVKGNQVWSISPDTLVIEALQIMTEKEIGALLVIEDGKIAGIISERDFVHTVAEKESCILQTIVPEYMTKEVHTVTPDTTLDECMQLMTDKHIRHLPVLDYGKLVGMISIGDIVKEIISTEKSQINALENYIQGTGYGQ